MTRTLPAIVCGVFLLAGYQSRSPATPGAETHEIAFAFRTHQPIAPVRLNGGRAVPFLFDTGASINAVDTGIAMEAGVAGRDARDMTGGGEGHAQVTFADSLLLQAGALTWSSQRAAILPLGFPDRKHFAGFIGAPILMRYVAQFDFAARVLRLFPPDGYASRPGAMVVPFELQDDLPVVRAVVDACSGPIEARLMLDTGAGDSAADLIARSSTRTSCSRSSQAAPRPRGPPRSVGPHRSSMARAAASRSAP
jgi:hypothetical protein